MAEAIVPLTASTDQNAFTKLVKPLKLVGKSKLLFASVCILLFTQPSEGFTLSHSFIYSLRFRLQLNTWMRRLFTNNEHHYNPSARSHWIEKKGDRTYNGNRFAKAAQYREVHRIDEFVTAISHYRMIFIWLLVINWGRVATLRGNISIFINTLLPLSCPSKCHFPTCVAHFFLLYVQTT